MNFPRRNFIGILEAEQKNFQDFDGVETFCKSLYLVRIREKTDQKKTNTDTFNAVTESLRRVRKGEGAAINT